MNATIFQVLLKGISTGSFSFSASGFLMIQLEQFWMSDVEEGQSGSSNSCHNVVFDNSELLFLYQLFIFLHVYWIIRFDNATWLSPHCRSILYISLSANLHAFKLLLLLEFINILLIFILVSTIYFILLLEFAFLKTSNKQLV